MPTYGIKVDLTFGLMRALRLILFPFSWLYASVLRLRHLCYDKGIIPSRSTGIKTIVLGNLEFGGTGKSPHTAWFVKALGDNKLAVLSRGHGRKTEGFITVEMDSQVEEVGDEPLMLKRDLAPVKVAVCEDRVIGVSELATEGFELVILDDAFQHRALKGGLNILLTSHHQPFWNNHLVPAGTLRDVKTRAKAADILIITKCPEDISELEMKQMRSKAKRFTGAKIFFSQMVYGTPKNIFEEGKPWSDNAEVLAVSGLAHNNAFFEQVAERFNLKGKLGFQDHHTYTEKDLYSIRERLSNFGGPLKAVLTTSKDAVKLSKEEWKSLLKDVDIYSLPMNVKIINDEQELITELKRYVR